MKWMQSRPAALSAGTVQRWFNRHVIRPLADCSSRGIMLALLIGLPTVYVGAGLATAYVLVPACRSGLTVNLTECTRQLRPPATGEISVSVRRIGIRTPALTTWQLLFCRRQPAVDAKARPAMMPVLAVDLVERHTDEHALELDMTAYDTQARPWAVDWRRAAEADRGRGNALVRITAPNWAGLRHVEQDVSVWKVRKLVVMNGLGDRVRDAASAGDKSPMSASDIDRVVLPELDCLLREATSGISRVSLPVRLIEATDPLGVLMLGIYAASFLLLLGRIVGGRPATLAHDRFEILVSVPAALGLVGCLLGMVSAVAGGNPDDTRTAIATSMTSTLIGASLFGPLVLLQLLIGTAAHRAPSGGSTP